jgi:hypothetical protein
MNYRNFRTARVVYSRIATCRRKGNCKHPRKDVVIYSHGIMGDVEGGIYSDYIDELVCTKCGAILPYMPGTTAFAVWQLGKAASSLKKAIIERVKNAAIWEYLVWAWIAIAFVICMYSLVTGAK